MCNQARVIDEFVDVMERSPSQYDAAPLTTTASAPETATGFPVGRRFWSTPALRVCDANPLEIGHLHRADGRFRLYVFADRPAPGQRSKLEDWARWAAGAGSPLRRFTPAGTDDDAVSDVKVIYQQDYTEVDLNAVPSAFRPTKGPFALADLNQVFAADAVRDVDAFRERGVSRNGAVVLVRPDMYVSAVLPLAATAELDDHLAGILLLQR